VNALVQEILYVGKTNPDMPLGTIFFGGGTPSILSANQYKKIFAALRDSFRIVSKPEITLESNPNDLSLEYLRGLREVGFNRLSVGMQSTTPQVLTVFKREHDTATVIQAIADAKTAGFDNISIDLIFGAPYQTLADWEDTLNTAIDLKIQNVSAYNLIVEGGTPLKTKLIMAHYLRPMMI
jgi:oxygen-independent coproporphyrinogen-3 oxidase